MAEDADIIPIGQIGRSILLIRGQKVVLDSDLAAMYGVQTERLNEQVRRNIERFPEDFMFQLTPSELRNLIPQFAGSRRKWGGSRKLPLAFTEHGALMAASVLKTEQAVRVSVYVVRAFVKLREMLSANKQLAVKLDELERKLQNHDQQIAVLFKAIKELMSPPSEPRKKPIGFATEMEAHEAAKKKKKN